jgi:hypothetical protein
MFEREHAKLDAMIVRARTELHRYRDFGQPDDAFITDLVRQFVAQIEQHPAAAGPAHMAFSLYRMVILQERLDTLLDLMNLEKEPQPHV